MQFSESSINIAKALKNAQAHLKKASKNAANPHLKYKYADLESVFDACKDALNECDLFFSQGTINKEGKEYLRTIVMHTSGEYVQTDMPLLLDSNARGAQMASLGAAITYARRYSICSLLGISTGDEDDIDKTYGAPKPQQAPQPKPAKPEDDEHAHLVRQVTQVINHDTAQLDPSKKNEIIKKIKSWNNDRNLKELTIEELKTVLVNLKDRAHLDF